MCPVQAARRWSKVAKPTNVVPEPITVGRGGGVLARLRSADYGWTSRSGVGSETT